MSDHSELKIAAELATQGLRVVTREWSYDDFEYQQEIFTVWSECETLEINIDGSFVGKDKADAEFIAAANPAAVLELIAEVEGLRAKHGRDSAELRRLCQARDDARKERDQLKAEIEALRNLARELRGSAECTNVHHCKSEQHDLDEPCKVLARIDAAMTKGDHP